MSSSDKPLHCIIKPPIPLTIGDYKVEFHSGCRIVDVTFPNVINPEVGEIRFKNYYVALLTIRMKYKTTDNGEAGSGDWKWKTVIRRMKLMPDPHCERGSQDFFYLTRKHFNCDISNLSCIRFILQQPSPVWKDFFLDDLRFFRTPKIVRPSPLPSWICDDIIDQNEKEMQIEFFTEKLIDTFDFNGPEQPFFDLLIQEGMPDVEKLSANLQQLWALAEGAATRQASVDLGRYEVDGCYEINLLSYT